MSENKW